MSTVPDAQKDRPLSAVTIARATWQRGGVCDFDEDLAAHLESGFVFALPRLFVMARAVELDDNRKAWLVSHAHGDLRRLVSVMPFPLEWIAFHRRSDRRLRVYRLPRLLQLANRPKL